MGTLHDIESKKACDIILQNVPSKLLQWLLTMHWPTIERHTLHNTKAKWKLCSFITFTKLKAYKY